METNNKEKLDKNTKTGFISAIIGSILNFFLAVTKLFIGLVTNSICIFFDAINNFTDIITGACGAVGISLSKKKPTKKYPNGFGRIEYIITFVISAITLMIGGVFIFYSIERIVYPFPVVFGWLYFGLLIVTMLVKILMGIGYYFVHKKDKSDITKALYIDSFMDAVITGSTVLCYGLCLVTNTIVDAFCGIFVGIMILVSAGKTMFSTIKKLLGYNEEIELDKIKNKLLELEIFSSIESIKLNDYGKDKIELYIFGNINDNKEELLSEIEKESKIKIYAVKNVH